MIRLHRQLPGSQPPFLTNGLHAIWRKSPAVIAAGGGAYIVGQDLKATHPTHSNATIPTNPRFAVAERYARFGLCSTSAT